MGFAKPIEQYLFSNLLIRIHVFMYLKDIIRGEGYINEIMKKFGLESVEKIIYDNSSHYRSYLDIGWKADGK